MIADVMVYVMGGATALFVLAIMVLFERFVMFLYDSIKRK